MNLSECLTSQHLNSFVISSIKFLSGGGRALSDQMGVKFLGEVPIDPRIAASMDSGANLLTSGDSSHLDSILDNIFAS